MQKENEADFVEAKKLRKDEVLAAWKIRYETALLIESLDAYHEAFIWT